MTIKNLKGYSTWEHWEHDKHLDFFSCKDLKRIREDISHYPLEWLSGSFTGRHWMYLKQEHPESYDYVDEDRDMSSFDDFIYVNITYVGVFRSDISHNLDLYVVKLRDSHSVLMEEAYNNCVNQWKVMLQGPTENCDDLYDNKDYTVRELETHDYMVCGYGADDDKPFFMLASDYGIIPVSPAELRLLVIFNAVGGLCIRNNLVCLTSAMQKVYGYEGIGVGQYSFAIGGLWLPLPEYMRFKEEGYKEEWCMETTASYVRSLFISPDLIVYELLSAGFWIDTDNGDKLTKAALARHMICSTR